MAKYVATKARILVTVATAGAMFAGVAGLQANAVEKALQAEVDGSATAANTVPVAAPTPTATTVKKKKKKKKKPAAATVVVQPAPAPAPKPAKNHGSSSGSK